MIEDFLWWVGKKVGRIVLVSLCVSMFVHKISTLDKKKTAGPIETGEIPSNALEREKTIVLTAERSDLAGK